MLHKLDISRKLLILLLLGTGTIISALGGLIYSIVNNSVREQVDAYQIEISETIALKATSQLNHAVELAVTARNTVMSLREKGVLNREAVEHVLLNLLKEKPDVFGLYMEWDPNTYDGKDKEYAEIYGNKKTGGFVPYAYKTPNGGYSVEKGGVAENLSTGDYYLLPKQNQQMNIVEPYYYPVENRQVLMTTVAIPMIENGKFLGVSSADFELSNLQKVFENVKPMETGRMGILSEKGVWVVAPRTDELNKPISDTMPQIADMVAQAASSKQTQQQTVELTDGRFLTSVKPLSIGDAKQQWFVVVQIPESTVYATVSSILNKLILFGLIGMAILAVLVYAFMESMLRKPLSHLNECIRKINNGEYDITVKGTTRQDDVGALSKAVESYRASSQSQNIFKQEQEQVRQEREAMETQRKDSLRSLADRFGKVVGGNSQQYVSGSQEPNFNEVANSSKEMQIAIEEVNQQMVGVQDVIRTAVKQSAELHNNVEFLKTSSQHISQVTVMINDVAENINLLALNASIEAARAGDAGRGFSVVAQEVKKLSERTSSASDEIATQVRDMQSAVDGSVGIIQSIVETIKHVDNASNTVAAAIEEQSASIRSISGSVQHIRQRAEELVDHIAKGS